MTISQVKIDGTLYTYIGPKPGLNPGVIQYEDEGTKEIAMTAVEEVITV